jgi:predicted PhzF superfamily epimerase YddE/YHI9
VTEPTTYLTSEQGLELGRPSTLYVEVDSRAGEVTGVRVGGQVVAMAEGEVRF